MQTQFLIYEMLAKLWTLHVLATKISFRRNGVHRSPLNFSPCVMAMLVRKMLFYCKFWIEFELVIFPC